MKPSTSVLVERSIAAVEPQRVGRSNPFGAIVALRQRERRLLVRNGHIGPDIAVLGETGDERLEFFRRHRLAPVFGVKRRAA